MSQIGKKEKSLSTKSNVNKKKTNSVCSKESSSNFDSFFSLSLANKKENKDDSLLGSECHMKDISYQHNESDLFKFPSKSKATGKNDVVSETSFESKASESDNAFQEETKVDTSLELHLLGTKPNIFNDTTLTSSDHEESNKECIKSDSFEITIEKGNSELNNLDEEVPISRAKVCRNPPTVEDKKYVTNKDGSEVTNQCPICLKTVTKYLSHMKSCAAKNKLSTQQLLSALKLHKKQLAERKELGLGLPIQSYRAKVSPKRSRANDKKNGIRRFIDRSRLQRRITVGMGRAPLVLKPHARLNMDTDGTYSFARADCTGQYCPIVPTEENRLTQYIFATELGNSLTYCNNCSQLL
ncbi:hypothetical protein J6590_020172 [Homalodisca vitripennis]|nr:hypothetical protein J6590_020172 [Homalodisca vitripennis]